MNVGARLFDTVGLADGKCTGLRVGRVDGDLVKRSTPGGQEPNDEVS